MNAITSAEYLTVAGAAAILNVSESTIRRWIREGVVPAYRVGRRSVRLKREDLNQQVTPLVEFERVHDEPTLAEVIEKLSRPLTEEKRRQWFAALDGAKRLADAMLAERGGELFPPSWELINQARDEWTRQLEEIHDQYKRDVE